MTMLSSFWAAIPKISYFFIFLLVIVVVFLKLGIFGFGQFSFLGIAPTVRVNYLFEPPKECMSQSDGYKKWTCLRPYFEELTDKISAKAAISEATKFKEQGIISDCHIPAHYIGEANLGRHNFDLEKAFYSCSVGECRAGCYHGVVERYIRNKADPANIIFEIKNVCDRIEGADSDGKRSCLHGVGHALLAHDYLSFQGAVDACSTFGADWAPFCVRGLSMENMYKYLSLDLDEDNLREAIPEICASVKSKESEVMEQCIVQVASGLLFYTGYDVELSEELCEELSQKDYVVDCKNYIRGHVKHKKPSNIDIDEFLKLDDY